MDYIPLLPPKGGTPNAFSSFQGVASRHEGFSEDGKIQQEMAGDGGQKNEGPSHGVRPREGRSGGQKREP
jgi:hypothetical protein